MKDLILSTPHEPGVFNDIPENGKTLTKTIYTSKEERDIAYLIETDDWLNKIG